MLIEAGRIVSVNRGAVEPFAMPRGLRRSAIDKRPVNGPVAVGPLGLAGDEQAERRFHGGPLKAVYAYAEEDLAWWSAQLGRTLAPGFIGENLTIAGIDLNGLRVGDELHVGSVVLRVTEPRDPCAKLAARIGLAGFAKRFGRAARTGVYCSVVRPGLVESGDAVRVALAGAGPTIREIAGARFGGAPVLPNESPADDGKAERQRYEARAMTLDQTGREAIPNGDRESDSFVQSLARGLSVIRAFGPNHGSMTLSEVAARAEITRAGARRVLLTLQRLGYVAADGRRFRLTPKILDLGYSFLSSLDIWEFAEPIMERLVDAVHESCSASVLDGDDIVYVMRVPTRRIMSINLGIGSRLPAYATSMGRVLLAALVDRELGEYLKRTTRPRLTEFTRTGVAELQAAIAEIRRSGWSLVDQELEQGLRSIAVPLTDGKGRVVAALNVSAHASRVSAHQMISDILPHLQDAKRQIDSGLPLRR